MSDRSRVIVILLIVGLLAGGGGYYFFKVYRPAQDLKGAQTEITSWEERYQRARDCLLGKNPGSAKTSEALAIREMAPDPWDRGKCTPMIKTLNRGSAPDTGIPAVEQAWGELEKAATKAAVAYALHVSESTTQTEDPLPKGLDDLDAARAKLRSAAQMKAAAHAGPALSAAQIVPLQDGSEPVTSLTVDTIPSARGIVLFGRTPSRTVQVTLTSGGTPKVDRVGPGTVRSAPDTAWGAVATMEALRAGAFDAEGVLTAPTPLGMPGATIAAVGGTLNDGYVVFGNATEFVVARAKDGTLTPGKPAKITVAQAGMDVDGRIAIVWGTEQGTKGQILRPGGEEPAVELPGSISTLCLTSAQAWMASQGNAIAFGGGRPTFTKTVAGRLQGCTPDAALFRSYGNEPVSVCTDECRVAALPTGAPTYATTTVVGGKLVAIAAHAGVLGVWREGRQPVFYALPDASTKPVLANEWPAMAFTDGKVIDVIARSQKTFVIVRIPAA